MLRKSLSLMLVTVAASCLVAGPAYASSAVTGDPWVDQYIEQVPSATGGVNGGGVKLKSGLSQEQMQALSDAGGDQFAYATGATVPGTPRGNARAGTSASVSVPSASASLTSALGGESGGLGLVLPAALLGSVVGAFALAVSRQRRNHS